MTTESPADFPLFRKYTMKYLVDISGYSLTHFQRIRRGQAVADQRFRMAMVGALGETEAQLFGESAVKPTDGLTAGDFV